VAATALVDFGNVGVAVQVSPVSFSEKLVDNVSDNHCVQTSER
jgi:hypothetical protein